MVVETESDDAVASRRGVLSLALERYAGEHLADGAQQQPRNEFEDRYAYYPASTVEQIRNQVVMSALKGAAIRLGGLREGRKSIIFVSEASDHPAAAVERSVAAMPGGSSEGSPSFRTAIGRNGCVDRHGVGLSLSSRR
jgi:hypothetical protein